MTAELRRVALVLAVAGSVVTVLPRPAAAVDGVIEINQARVAAAGGFPFNITQSGSYRLTSNLTVPDAGTDGIDVSGSGLDVTIDLNGFAIRGPVQCTPSPPAAVTSCTPSGGGAGVNNVGGASNVHVFNGTIAGMGYFGILGATRVESIHEHDSVIGIATYYAGHVIDSIADGNLTDGISASPDSLIRGSSVSYNGVRGIDGTSRCVLVGNVANRNGGIGIQAGDSATISGNTAAANGVGASNGYGITAGPGSTVSGNTVTSNTYEGIQVQQGSTVLDNTVRSNGGLGLYVWAIGPSPVGYGRNVFTGNNGGDANPQVFGGTELPAGSNICGSHACP